MVPCPSSKTLGPATNNFEHQAQITSVSTFTQECPDFLPSCQDYSCSSVRRDICQRQVAQFRGASRPIASDIGLILFAGAEARPRAPFAWAAY